MSIIHDYSAINKAAKAISSKVFDVGEKKTPPLGVLTMCLYASTKCPREYCNAQGPVSRCEYRDTVEYRRKPSK